MNASGGPVLGDPGEDPRAAGAPGAGPPGVRPSGAEPAGGGSSSFVGRRQELSAVRLLLRQTRLLTLTGAGGVGKTRLARQAVESLDARFPDGVELVELATLEDGDLLESAVAAALGLHDLGRHMLPVLVDHLADKRMLLVLDNCEHLLRECGVLVDGLLRAAPRLRILTTSRHTLGVGGEQVLPVPALPVPEAGGGLRAIARCEAVRLFAERAAEARPGFVVDAANAEVVAGVARLLDGMPLAIELAAVRLRTTPLEELARGLDDRFKVLTGGSANALPRHQALRATVEWSFGLCSPDERLLWARLSMFPGGADLGAAEAVCSGEGIAREEVFDLVAGLVDKSVLAGERRGAVVRYRMLDSLRAYGRERLAPADDRALSRRYLEHYRRLAERNRVDRLRPDQLERFQTLHDDFPNVRLALDLCFGRLRDPLAGLELASVLWAYWIMGGALTEGRHWLERGLELIPEAGAARVRALWADALLAIYQGDLAEVRPRLEECGALAGRAGDESALAYAVQTCGLAALAAGDGERGFALMEEARARHLALGDVHAVGVGLFQAAAFGAVQDPEHAASLGAELLAQARASGASLFESYALLALGLAAWKRRDCRQAEALLREAVAIMILISDRWGLARCLETLAWIAGATGRHARAARLLGAAHRLVRATDSAPELWYTAHSHQDCADRARGALGARAYAAAFRSGTRFGPDRAVAFALGDG